jgi:hypothetical protein
MKIQKATEKIRIYPKTHKKLKIICAKKKTTFAKLIDDLLKQSN